MEKDDERKSESAKSWLNEVYKNKTVSEIPDFKLPEEHLESNKQKSSKTFMDRLEASQREFVESLNDDSLLTSCKACGENISKTATTCVHCGHPSKLFRFVRNFVFAYITLSFTLIFLIALSQLIG